VQAAPTNPAKERCEHRPILFILSAEPCSVNETAFQRLRRREAEAPPDHATPEEIRCCPLPGLNAAGTSRQEEPEKRRSRAKRHGQWWNLASTILPQGRGRRFVLDAAQLVRRFGWPAKDLRELIRRGLVTAGSNAGGVHAGRWCLSVLCGNRRWQPVIAADGAIAEEQLEFVPPQKRRYGC
jgi:hypothetical protein